MIQYEGLRLYSFLYKRLSEKGFYISEFKLARKYVLFVDSCFVFTPSILKECLFYYNSSYCIKFYTLHIVLKSRRRIQSKHYLNYLCRNIVSIPR